MKQAVGNCIVLLVLAAMLVAALLLGPFWIGLFARCVSWMFLAISFTLAYSFARVPSVSQATIFGVGAYLAIWLAPYCGGDIVALVLAGGLGGALAALALGLLIYRMSLNGAAIATIIVAVVGFVLGNAAVPVTGGSNGMLLPTMTYRIAGAAIRTGASTFMLLFGTVLVVLLLISIWIATGTRRWTVVRAIRQNEVRARFLGYNVSVYRLAVFSLSGAVAGMGGALYALVSQQATSDLLSLGMSVKAILWAAVGGVSTVFGGPIGVLLVQIASELIEGWTLRVDSIIGVLLIVVALFVPGGLMGLLNATGSATPATERAAAAGRSPWLWRALSLKEGRPK